jgi:hypothetical protein
MNISWKIKRVLINNRLFFYLTGFVIVLTLAAMIADRGLRNLDFITYKAVYFNSDYDSFVSDRIFFIDIPEIKDVDYRERIVKLLDTINKMSSEMEIKDRPEAIILDFSFKENNKKDSLFIEAISNLQVNGVNVFGVYDVYSENNQLDYETNENERDSELYGKFSYGRLHTRVDIHEPSGIIWYESFLKFSASSGEIKVPALPLKAANPDNSILTNETYILPYGNQANLEVLTWTYEPNNNAGNSLLNKKYDESFNIRNKFIIIADVKNKTDQFQFNGKDVPGPYLLSWALLDQLEGNRLAIQPINNMWIQFLIVLSSIIFIALFFDWIFKRAKKLQTQPLILAVISFFAGLIILVVIIYFMPGNKIIRPGLPSLSMFMVAIFIWQYKKKYIKQGVIDGGETYDLFISYSRKQAKWVKKNVYIPLKGFKNSEDKKINIFFDEESIPPGEQFQDFYKEAILNSKIFLPVFSEDYFKSNHCTEEIKFAELRKTETKNTETNFRIYPITFNFDIVPKKHTDINIVHIDDENSFMKGLKEALYKG